MNQLWWHMKCMNELVVSSRNISQVAIAQDAAEPDIEALHPLGLESPFTSTGS